MDGADHAGVTGRDGAGGDGTADLAGLGLDEGGHLLVARALSGLRPGQRLAVAGTHPALRLHLAAWCREHGHRVESIPEGAAGLAMAVIVVRGTAGDRRWHGAEREIGRASCRERVWR